MIVVKRLQPSSILLIINVRIQETLHRNIFTF
jgi:hypothetical protein